MNNDNLKISLTGLNVGHVSLPAMSQPVRTQLAIPDFAENRRVFDLNQSTEIIEKVSKRTAFDFAILGLEFWWVKVNLRHSEWLPWIEKRIPYSQDTVRNFMAAAKAFMQMCGIGFGKKPTIYQLHQAWEIIRSNPELTQDFEFDVWRNKSNRDMATVPIEKRAIGQVNVYDKVVLFARNNWLNMSQEDRKTMLETIDFWIDKLVNLPNELEELGKSQLSEPVREAIREYVTKGRAELDEKRHRELDELLKRKVQLTMQLEEVNKQCERLRKRVELAGHASLIS